MYSTFSLHIICHHCNSFCSMVFNVCLLHCTVNFMIGSRECLVDISMFRAFHLVRCLISNTYLLNKRTNELIFSRNVVTVDEWVNCGQWELMIFVDQMRTYDFCRSTTWMTLIRMKPGRILQGRVCWCIVGLFVPDDLP